MATIIGEDSLNPDTNNFAYHQNRQKFKGQYNRPQAMVWANNAGFVNDSGTTTGASYPWGKEGEDFIITSDHNRSAINVDKMRIENKVRMINGNMRSYHTADKVTINVSWNLLPSRAFQQRVEVDVDGNITTRTTPYSQEPYLSSPVSEYTADGGAGGVDLVEWYNNTIGPMWVFLSYDSPQNFLNNESSYEMLKHYPHRHQMFFSSFNYSVEKRGLYDFWNVSVSLEEV
jgi:hypothetical protein